MHPNIGVPLAPLTLRRCRPACATTLAAHADTLQQFYASNINFYVGPNTPATTGSLVGSIIVDTTTGTVTSSMLQYDAVNGATYDFFRAPDQAPAGNTTHFYSKQERGVASLDIFIPGNFVNYAGGEVCYYPVQTACTVSGAGSIGQSSDIVGPNDSFYASPYSGGFTAGPLVTASTPEPSSFLLLGTGLLGALGAARKRFA